MLSQAVSPWATLGLVLPSCRVASSSLHAARSRRLARARSLAWVDRRWTCASCAGVRCSSAGRWPTRATVRRLYPGYAGRRIPTTAAPRYRLRRPMGRALLCWGDVDRGGQGEGDGHGGSLQRHAAGCWARVDRDIDGDRTGGDAGILGGFLRGRVGAVELQDAVNVLGLDVERLERLGVGDFPFVPEGLDT